MIYFLHDRGYNYFNMSMLTLPEINLLVSENNKKVKEANRQQRLAKKGKK